MAAPIPEQLPVVLKDFTKAVLKSQPEDIVEFAAAFVAVTFMH